jgi:protoporphyrin/coproporphyrin ferrochelatase
MFPSPSIITSPCRNVRLPGDSLPHQRVQGQYGGLVPDYDAFLLVSFGGPEGPDDVIPFLRNVTRGRGVPAERLEEVAQHYMAFGGVSPLGAQCRGLLAAVGADFAARGVDLPLYWGNRNWQPYLTDTVAQMAAAGVRRAVAFVTSAYSSYSACRQYRDAIERARAEARQDAPVIDKIRPYFNHPGFIEPFAGATRAALASLPPQARAGARLVFTAHSVPEAMAATSGSPSAGNARPGQPGGRYAAELSEAARLIAGKVFPPHAKRAEGASPPPIDLVYQSRSGPPRVPWLGPDISDHLADLAKEGVPGAVIVPVGFTSDHMEVVHDLDVEAARAAATLGLPLARAAAPMPDPRFAAMVTDLVLERMGTVEPASLGDFGPAAGDCPADCCSVSPGAEPPVDPRQRGGDPPFTPLPGGTGTNRRPPDVPPYSGEEPPSAREVGL